MTLISEDTLAELFSVLRREKFRPYIPQDRAMEYVEWYAGISETVLVTQHVTACRDPKDDKFLALAVTTRADCLITGDSDLLDMIAYDGIPIYRATDFLARFATEDPQEGTCGKASFLLSLIELRAFPASLSGAARKR